ncbi:methyl-accepting chemotaxis protein [uncultured Aquitalea sp.]|uniref:methyl-accepting chemotaxis protein n=1 Tax=uncultured Aquitalea sp. TaxID=540272 RepID=UPI0025DFEAB6|nr:methyl-accepting chemotaxis protein [uncultured Aquitalea sp.]
MAANTITDWFIPEHVRQSPESAIRARTVVGVGLLAGCIAPLFSIEYFMLGHPAMGIGIALGGLCLLLGTFLLKLTGAVPFAGQFIIASMFAMVSWMVYVNGGIMSTSVVWFASIPFTAIFVSSRRSGWIWMAMTVLAIGLFWFLSSQRGALPVVPIKHEEIPTLQAKSLIGLTIVVLSLALAFDKAKVKSFERLEKARAEAEQTSRAMQALMEQVTRSIQAASSASRDITDSTGLMANTMADQRSRAEDMVAVAQQMAVVTSQNAEQSATATHLAQTAGTAAATGGEVMDQAMRQLGRAGEVISLAASKLEELGQRSTEVNGIVQLIRDIADQTNLLALNAAIEAARAGEMGRGFAVVADEVRKLAERTQNATLDIESKIKLIVDGTNQAIVAMRDGNSQMKSGRDNAHEAQEKLQGIIAETRQLAGLLDQVSQAEQSQNQGFAQFASDITAVGESTRALSTETSSIADAIRRLDQLLDELGRSSAQSERHATLV